MSIMLFEKSSNNNNSVKTTKDSKMVKYVIDNTSEIKEYLETESFGAEVYNEITDPKYLLVLDGERTEVTRILFEKVDENY